MPKRSYVIIFGEDESDRMALEELVRAIAPASYISGVKRIRKPPILGRNAHKSGKQKKMADHIAGFARAFEDDKGRVIVVLHRDCDDFEPAHEQEATVLLRSLSDAGVKKAVVATPAWEIEAWWMLFPEAVARVRPCWQKLDYGSTNVGRIRNAKERLRLDLTPIDTKKKRNCPEYNEYDGSKIAHEIAKSPHMIDSHSAVSNSFAAFKTSLRDAFE